MKYTLKKWARKLVGLKQIQDQVILEAEFKAGDKIIDVGCGTGMLLEQIYTIHGKDLEYMGIEPDEVRRQRAEIDLAGKEIKLKRAFANHLPSIQDYYTHVICMVSFHHFPKEEWKASLEELKRVLAPGGKLIIVEFGKPSGLAGWVLAHLNTCQRLAKGLENFLKIEAKAIGLDYVTEHKQFGYITHLIFTK